MINQNYNYKRGSVVNPETTFRVNSPNVVHETIDGEAVIINLMTGRYYSLEEVGVDIWDLIERNTSIAEMVVSLQHHYDTKNHDVEDVLTQFIEQLKEEELIVPEPTRSVSISNLSGISNGQTSLAEKPVFALPILRKYTDMEALLVLDPIHEVDETGWPNSIEDSR